ncbi:hypothetical protein [Nocardiopsis potens]|uniref:hypothetical protein n=1 Tax=Nocardiopsis potens TaxID=1246458 RepID=UPI00034D715F|nr:hypothetical protein [Nocardiopsis potens]
MRWVWRAEAGGFKIEYAAVVILVATIVTAVFAFGLPTDVKVLYAEGICRIMPDSEGCDGEGQGGDQETGGSDQDGTPGEEDGEGREEEPSTSPSAPPETDGEDGESGDGREVLYDPELAGDLEDAEQDLADAESALAGADSDQLYDDLMNLLGDIVGYNDAKACLTEGDIVACLWTIVGFSPFGKGAKLIKNGPKIYKLWNRWRKAKKTKEGLEKAVDTAKGKVDDALDACGVPGKKNRSVVGVPALLAGGGALSFEGASFSDPPSRWASGGQVRGFTVDGLYAYRVLAGGMSPLAGTNDPRNVCGDAAKAANVSLKKLKEKQLKKILERYDTDPHEFKEDYVGKGAISKFDVAKGDDGFLWLVTKDGNTTIKTYEKW